MILNEIDPFCAEWLETPGWDTCSPGWNAWVTVQRLLALCCAKPDEIASDD